MVQIGTDAQVFRARRHNIPKLLANQLTDGDSLIQSVVTGLQEESRKSVMDGFEKCFIEMDNHSALEVGHMREGRRLFKVQKPKFSEDCAEV